MIIEDSLVELKSTKIWKYLQDTDKVYAELAISFVYQLTPILEQIQEVFPLFTRHDAHHGYRVLKRMEQVIKSDCLKKGKRLSLNNIEAFLLICSAYAHDLGMAVFPNEKEDLLNHLGIKFDSDWKSNPILQQHLREKHSERGGMYIDQNSEILKFPKNLVNHLHLLMKAHNMSVIELDAELSERMAGGETEIDLKQLACILCIADSLEFSETRIVSGVMDLLKDKIKNAEDFDALKSYQENMKHKGIGDSLAIGKDGCIVVSGTFDDPEVLNLTHKTIDCIEDWVRKYIDISFTSPLGRIFVTGINAKRRLTILESDFVRLGIRIKKDHIIKLISSKSTWNDQSSAIKELLQNSVEACRYRSFNSAPSANYLPKIVLEINKKDKKIVLSDNGCGMSRNTILDNFLTVGNSRSLNPTYSTGSFKSLARFGIGFWSIFTIAEDVDISSGPFEYLRNKDDTTNVIDGLQFTVSVNEFKDYTLFKKISRTPGTTITISIKPEIALDDLVTGIKNKLICSEIPIEIRNDDDLYQVPSNVQLPTLKELTNSKYEFAIYQEVKEYVYEKQYDDFEFKMKLLYRLDGNALTFMLKSGKYGGNSIKVLMMSTAINIKFSICGFAINKRFSNNELAFNLESVGTVVCNMNNPEGFVFNILRLELLSSEKEEKISELITDGIHDGYRQFLIDHNSYNKESIYELNVQSVKNYGISCHYTHQKLYKIHCKHPDLLSFKLYCVEVGKDLLSANISYLNLDELCSQEYELWTCSPINYFKKEDAQESKFLPFQIISNYVDEKSGVFYIPYSSSSDMLFDNDSNSYIEILQSPNSLKPQIPFMRMYSKSIVPTAKHPWYICNITGIWSGDILEKKIIGGSNYVFIGQNKLIVNPESKICKYVHELYDNKNIIKLCQFVIFLKDAVDGYIDESLKEYL